MTHLRTFTLLTTFLLADFSFLRTVTFENLNFWELLPVTFKNSRDYNDNQLLLYFFSVLCNHFTGFNSCVDRFRDNLWYLVLVIFNSFIFAYLGIKVFFWKLSLLGRNAFQNSCTFNNFPFGGLFTFKNCHFWELLHVTLIIIVDFSEGSINLRPVTSTFETYNHRSQVQLNFHSKAWIW